MRTICTRHHWNHPPPEPPQLPRERRYSPLGIGVAVVVIGALVGYAAGQLGPADPCITVSDYAMQDTTTGYWYEVGVPIGWSEPWTNNCIQEVPDHERP